MGYEIVGVVSVADERVALLRRDADNVDDDLGDQSGAGGGVNGEGLVPVRREEAVDGVFHGQRPIGADDDGFLDQVGEREVDG